MQMGFVSHPLKNALIKEGLKGGAFAYFNQKAGFGVEQRFDPAEFENLNLFWSPERIQVNLEMVPNWWTTADGKYGVHTNIAGSMIILNQSLKIL
jgi:hypothetical protein